jgi:hypothetical protein
LAVSLLQFLSCVRQLWQENRDGRLSAAAATAAVIADNLPGGCTDNQVIFQTIYKWLSHALWVSFVCKKVACECG